LATLIFFSWMEISDERMILVLFRNASQRILCAVLCRGTELRRPVKVERVVLNALGKSNRGFAAWIFGLSAIRWSSFPETPIRLQAQE